ncbi:MAG: hypothetical protein NTZ90_07890 [Proteobacteria bacterium]|nr:hypothetical protein [Pseudomonadota bacterium]
MSKKWIARGRFLSAYFLAPCLFLLTRIVEALAAKPMEDSTKTIFFAMRSPNELAPIDLAVSGPTAETSQQVVIKASKNRGVCCFQRRTWKAQKCLNSN